MDGLLMWFFVGGAAGTRTPYPLLAKQVLSLMSYSPTTVVRLGSSSFSGVHTGANSLSLKAEDSNNKHLNCWIVKGNGLVAFIKIGRFSQGDDFGFRGAPSDESDSDSTLRLYHPAYRTT